ncbi:hypothetical protein J4419_02620 [Candidatus Woesearchaeota archaeon]|nr:hypothetical protein [Candidatus Woesearchaeota archaeon]
MKSRKAPGFIRTTLLINGQKVDANVPEGWFEDQERKWRQSRKSEGL